MVLLKMLMKIALPDERIVGDDDGDYFAFPEGSFPGRTAPLEP